MLYDAIFFQTLMHFILKKPGGSFFSPAGGDGNFKFSFFSRDRFPVFKCRKFLCRSRALFCLFLYLLFAFLLSMPLVFAENIILQLGESRRFKSPLYEKVWLSQNQSISLQDTGDGWVEIRARRPGQSLLAVGNHVYSIFVTSPKVKKDFLLLQDFLSTRQGLAIRLSPLSDSTPRPKSLPQQSSSPPLNSKFNLPLTALPQELPYQNPPGPAQNPALLVTGTLLRLKDFQDLSLFAQQHQISYYFLAHISKDLRPIIKHFLSKKYRASPLPLPALDLHFLWEQKPLTIPLPAASPLQTMFFKQYGIKTLVSKRLLDPAPLVELKILLAEMSQSHITHPAFSWELWLKENPELAPPSQDFDTSSLSTLFSTLLTDGIRQSGRFLTKILTGSFQSWLTIFQAMEHKGQAHILAHSTLLNESGKSSKFHAGGEVPIPHYHPETGATSIKWKPYGLRLNFQTKTDSRNKIHIQTHVHISEVDHTFSLSSAPAVKTSSFNSSLTLKDGQTLALATLLREQGGRNNSSPEILSKAPFIKDLRQKIKNRTRLHIFITAHIKKGN